MTFKFIIKAFILFFILISVIICFAIYDYSDNKLGKEVSLIAEELKLETDKENILESREVDWIVTKEDGTSENKGKIISYDYVTDEVVKAQEHKGMSEIMDKRKPNSQTYALSQDKEKTTYVSKFSLDGDDFFKKADNKWYKIKKKATTTIEVFDEQMKVSLGEKILNLFTRKAFADTNNLKTGVGDGRVKKYWSTTWSTIHDASAGNDTDYTTAEPVMGAQEFASNGYWISKIFLPILTGNTISAGATVSSSTLYIAAVTGQNAHDADGYNYYTLVDTYQASTSVLVHADYIDCGSDNGTAGRSAQTSIVEGIATGDRIDSDDIPSTYPTYATSSFPLNATGLGWVKASGDTSTCGTESGWTCLGIREGHDMTNNAPSNEERLYIFVKLASFYLEVVWSVTVSDTCTPVAGTEWWVEDECYIDTDIYHNRPLSCSTTAGMVYIKPDVTVVVASSAPLSCVQLLSSSSIFGVLK